jgi:hypothetical protein
MGLCAITDLKKTADVKFLASAWLELPPCSVFITNETLYTNPMQHQEMSIMKSHPLQCTPSLQRI